MPEQGKSKRQLLREKRAREQMRSRYFSFGLIALGAIFVIALIVIPILNRKEAPPRERPNVSDNAMGDPNAPITITEYSDYQCPFCRRFWEDTEEQLALEYVATGKVYFVYRSFGGFIGQESQDAAEAAYCASAQGRFWEMHDTIFTNQTGENVGAFSRRNLSAFARQIGLNMDTYEACMNNGTFTDRVIQDGKDGVAAGVKATPSFILSYVVNGETRTRLIEGAQGFGAFQAEILAALAEMGLQ
ncbi:MAG: thioredoxin domain-containing protein [Chloroflexota bacterium]